MGNIVKTDCKNCCLFTTVLLLFDFVMFSSLSLVEGSTTMLDSESRYLPVLSEPSSGPSSPQVRREDVGRKQAASNTSKPRRIVANFASQLTVQQSDVILQPIKSTSHPKSCSTTVSRHSQSPVARKLHLKSSDALEPSVADAADTLSSHGTEVRQVSDAKRKTSRRSRDENGIIALSSLYTPEKYRDTMRQIYGGDGERTRMKQVSGNSSDTSSCTDKLSHLVKDGKSIDRTADIVNGNRPDLRGKSTCKSS